MNRSHKRHPQSHLPDANMVSHPNSDQHLEILIGAVVLGVSDFLPLALQYSRDQNLTGYSFHVGNPEGIHQLLVLFSDRGTPRSVRYMNGYSGHTYRFTKPVSDIFRRFPGHLIHRTLRMARSSTPKSTSKRSKASRISPVRKLPGLPERIQTT